MSRAMATGGGGGREQRWGPLLWMGASAAVLVVFLALPAAMAPAVSAPYPLLHAVLGVACIALSIMVFAAGWNRRGSARNPRCIWLGAVFLAVAAIDFGHAPAFGGEDGAAGSGGLWFAGRAVLAFGLSAVLFLGLRRWSAGGAAAVHAAMLVLAALCWWMVPRAALLMAEPFASGAEYALAAFCVFAAMLLYRRGERDGDDTLRWLGAAAWVLGLAGLFALPHGDGAGAGGVLGHACQAVAAAMIYRALQRGEGRESEAELAGERALLRALIDSMPDQIAFKDTRGAYLGCNSAFAACRGRAEHDIVGRTDAELASLGSWPADGGAASSERLPAKGGRREEWVVGADGTRRLLDTMSIPFRTQDGALRGEIGISRDITDRRWIEEQLAASERRLALALESASLGLWDWHVPSGWVSYDAQWAGMIGLTPDEIEPSLESWESRVNPGDWPVVRAALEPHLRGETLRYVCEHRLRHENGNWVWVLASGSVIERDEDGVPLRIVGIHQDISARKALEERLVQQATSDPLTGLANRRYFDAALAGELARVRRKVGRAAVVLLDLDHFKRINDQWGHAAGDEVLKHCTSLVAERLRDSDMFARLGGEEFAILLPGVDLLGAFRTAERLRRLVADNPACGDFGEIRVTVSIGVATLRAGDGSPAEAIARADEALYRAKDAGRNRTVMEEGEAVSPPLAGEPAPAGSPEGG